MPRPVGEDPAVGCEARGPRLRPILVLVVWTEDAERSTGARDDAVTHRPQRRLPIELPEFGPEVSPQHPGGLRRQASRHSARSGIWGQAEQEMKTIGVTVELGGVGLSSGMGPVRTKVSALRGGENPGTGVHAWSPAADGSAGCARRDWTERELVSSRLLPHIGACRR